MEGVEAALAVSGQTRIHWESSARGAFAPCFKRNTRVARKALGLFAPEPGKVRDVQEVVDDSADLDPQVRELQGEFEDRPEEEPEAEVATMKPMEGLIVLVYIVGGVGLEPMVIDDGGKPAAQRVAGEDADEVRTVGQAGRSDADEGVAEDAAD